MPSWSASNPPETEPNPSSTTAAGGETAVERARRLLVQLFGARPREDGADRPERPDQPE